MHAYLRVTHECQENRRTRGGPCRVRFRLECDVGPLVVGPVRLGGGGERRETSTAVGGSVGGSGSDRCRDGGVDDGRVDTGHGGSWGSGSTSDCSLDICPSSVKSTQMSGVGRSPGRVDTPYSYVRFPTRAVSTAGYR